MLFGGEEGREGTGLFQVEARWKSPTILMQNVKVLYFRRNEILLWYRQVTWNLSNPPPSRPGLVVGDNSRPPAAEAQATGGDEDWDLPS